ncbi:MAG: hypothetical protein MK101_10040 [Phycisphaerales bacterium]|nr:hypothetical protein [Phycisphaerales bacterium]
MNMFLRVSLLALAAASLSGCAVLYAASGMAQNFEYQKEIVVHAQYEGLDHHTVAVLVDSDLALRYERPRLVPELAVNISRALAKHVTGIKILPPQAVIQWQYNTPEWNLLPRGEVCEQLGVERVLWVDLQTFRLHPQGNTWIWEGVVEAEVGVVEEGGLDPDAFVDAWRISAAFPDINSLDRDSASEESIRLGLEANFVKRTAWLFYSHVEPKYPDKFRSENASEQAS